MRVPADTSGATARAPTRLQTLFFSLATVLSSCVSTTGPKDARRVDSVTIAGNVAVSDQALIGGLETRPPRGIIRRKRVRVDQLALETDRDRIETYYRRKGFYSARVSSPQIRPLDKRRVSVGFVVDEGLPSLVSTIAIEGAPSDPNCGEGALRERLLIRDGEPFEHDLYMRSKDALLEQLVEHGYPYASIKGDVLVQPTTRKVDINLTIDAGPLASFGKTTVTGLVRVPLSAIMHRLAWTEGETFDAGKLQQTRSYLNELRMFSIVRVDFDPNAPTATVPMRVTVVEAPRHTVRLGGGVGIDRVRWEIRGRAGYELSHVFGSPLTTLALEGRPAYATISGVGGEQGLVGEFRATLRREDFLWPLLRGSAMASYAVEEIEAYTSQGPSMRLFLSRLLWKRRLQVVAGYGLRRLDFLRVSDAIDGALAADLGLESPYRIALLDQRVAYDGRDDPISPHRGYYAELRLEEANRFWGSAFSSVTLAPELRGYVPFGDRVTMAARTRLGLLVAGADLPITLRYFGGGATSHRGFAQRRLSPIASTAGESVGIGGSALWESSLEARIDTWQVGGQWLSVALFVDAGDVRLQVDELDPLRPHLAAGAGLRYRSLVGPLRFDLAYRLNRRGAGEPVPGENLAFHITLGEAF